MKLGSEIIKSMRQIIIGICDDQPEVLEALQKMLDELCEEKGISSEIRGFTDGNYYLSEVDQETKVQVSGFVDEILEIDNVSLCSVHTNLLKNAIEELARIENGTKFLNVVFSQGECFFSIEIQNSLSEESKKKRNLLVSEKEDKRNHGIGLKNVKRIVKKNGGEFDTHIENGMFIARVVLKCKKMSA